MPSPAHTLYLFMYFYARTFAIRGCAKIQTFYFKIKNWFMLSVRTSSYGCTREVWRAREKRKSCSRRSREQL